MTDTLLRAEPDLDAARVLRAGSDALTAASELLDRPAFDCAVEVLADCPGEVGVVGLGSSGFLAGHLATLLASRGTPATALAPSETGLEGLNTDDVVLAVAVGDEGDDLVPALHALRQRDVLVVAVVGADAGGLDGAADLVLPTGPSAELDALVALALGEALARGAAALRSGEAS